MTKSHIPRSLNGRHLFSYSSRGWTPKIMVWMGMILPRPCSLTGGQGLSLGPHLPLPLCAPFLGFLSVFNFLFLHGQESHWIRAQLKGLNLFIYLFKNSVCRYSHILSPCRLELQHISLGGHKPVLQSLSRSSPSQDCIHIYTLFLRCMVSNFILNATWNLFWYVAQILLRNRL